MNILSFSPLLQVTVQTVDGNSQNLLPIYITTPNINKMFQRLQKIWHLKKLKGKTSTFCRCGRQCLTALSSCYPLPQPLHHPHKHTKKNTMVSAITLSVLNWQVNTKPSNQTKRLLLITLSRLARAIGELCCAVDSEAALVSSLGPESIIYF